MPANTPSPTWRVPSVPNAWELTNANALGFKVMSPVFDGARESEITEDLLAANLPILGKTRLRLFFREFIVFLFLFMRRIHDPDCIRTGRN